MSRQLRRGPRRILIVDGYNVINAREGGAGGPLADARDRLLAELMDYAGWSDQEIVLVWDAWQSDRLTRTEERHGSVTVVYTQKGEIADRYIERLCDELAEDIELRRAEVRVASSDALEQTIILGRGAARMSSRELMYEMRELRAQGSLRTGPQAGRRTTISDRLPEDVRARLKAMVDAPQPTRKPRKKR